MEFEMDARRVADIQEDELTDEALDRSDGGRFLSSFVHSFFTKRYQE
jgi:hypothetical protein